MSLPWGRVVGPHVVRIGISFSGVFLLEINHHISIGAGGARIGRACLEP